MVLGFELTTYKSTDCEPSKLPLCHSTMYKAAFQIVPDPIKSLSCFEVLVPRMDTDIGRVACLFQYNDDDDDDDM